MAAEGAEILSGGPEDFVGEGSAPLYYSQLPLLHWVRGAAPSSTGAGAELGVGVDQVAQEVGPHRDQAHAGAPELV